MTKAEPFEKKYRVDSDTGCWVWIRSLNKDGYGKHTGKENGKQFTWAAHVYSYRKKHGPVPDGFELDHLCRNHACVNPDHLEPVTDAENVRRGLAAKLSVAQVQEIRSRYAAGGIKQVTLANEYGVMPSCIHKIVTGKSWMSDLTDQTLTLDNPLQWKRTKHGNNQATAAASTDEGSAQTSGESSGSEVKQQQTHDQHGREDGRSKSGYLF